MKRMAAKKCASRVLAVMLIFMLGLMMMVFIGCSSGTDDEGIENGEPVSAETPDGLDGKETAAFPAEALRVMAEVEPAWFTNIGAGNVSPELLAAVLNDAAVRERAEDFEERQAVRQVAYDLQEEEGEVYWRLRAEYLEGGEESVVGGSNPYVILECGLSENQVKVTCGRFNHTDTVYLHHSVLYQLVRHMWDYEEIVDGEDFARFEDILTAQMEDGLAMMKDNPGQFDRYELTRFHQVWEYEEADGSLVKLYDFDYALHPGTLKEIGWAGGMHMDSQLRVQGFNGGGQFAVRYRNGEVAATAFMGNDFSYSPASDPEGENENFAKEWLKSALDQAEG